MASGANTTLFTINGAAQRVPCPPQWLRQRDEVLRPIRDDSGRRLYDEARIEQARELRRRTPASAA